jgi:hypothetical protein
MSNSFYECHVLLGQSQRFNNKNHLRITIIERGNLTYGRDMHLTVQFPIVIFLLIPVSFVSLLASNMGRGSVLRIVLKKD